MYFLKKKIISAIGFIFLGVPINIHTETLTMHCKKYFFLRHYMCFESLMELRNKKDTKILKCLPNNQINLFYNKVNQFISNSK